MGYGHEEDVECSNDIQLSKLDQKVASYFEYDWTEWNELSHYEKISKRRIYKRFNK